MLAELATLHVQWACSFSGSPENNDDVADSQELI
jgi:hypothetical protein